MKKSVKTKTAKSKITAPRAGVKKKKSNEQKIILNLSKNISSAIISECDENNGLILVGLYKRSALIVKIKTVSVTNTLCAGSMTPVETFKEITFFDTFIVSWENKKKNVSIFTNKDKELPVYKVETEREALDAIKNA